MVRVLFYTSIISLVISAAFLFLPFYLIVILAAILFVSFILVLILKNKNKFNNAFMLFLCLVFSIYGILNLLEVQKIEKLSGKTAIVEGYITEDAESYDSYCSYVLNTTRVEIDGSTKDIPQKFKIRINESGDFAFSSFVNVKAKIKLNKIYGDFRNFSYSQKIYLNSYSAEVISCDEMQNKPIYYPAYLLSKGINKLLYSNMGYEDAALSSAVLLGDETGLTDEFYNNSKVTGVTHMLVVSGTHISIITMALHTFLKRIKFPQRLRPIFMLFITYLIMAVCGFSASVVRAGLTYVVYFVGDIVFKKSDGLNALGTATVILLFDSPFLFYNIGYLLSYVATYAVIALTGPIYRLVTKVYIPGFLGKIYYGAAFILAQTLAATFATLPISMATFGYFSIISPITNLLLASAVNGILIFSIFAVMIAAVPILNIFSFFLFFILTCLSKFSYFVINLFGNLEFALVEVEPIHVVAWILIAVAFIGYVFSRKIKDFIRVYKTILISSISLFLVGSLMFGVTFLKPQKNTNLTMIEVGNGICAIVTYKNASVLVGLGDNLSDHKRITDRLFKLGKRGVDLILIPNATKEYCGGYTTLENINSNYIVANSIGAYSSALKQFDNITYFKNQHKGSVGDIKYSVNKYSTIISTPDTTIEFNIGAYFNRYSDVDILVTLNYIPEKFDKKAIVCGNKIDNIIEDEDIYYLYNDITFNLGD